MGNKSGLLSWDWPVPLGSLDMGLPSRNQSQALTTGILTVKRIAGGDQVEAIPALKGFRDAGIARGIPLPTPFAGTGLRTPC